MPLDPGFKELVSDPRNTVHPPPAHVPLDKVRRAADAAMDQGDAPAMAIVRDDATRVAERDIPFRHYRPTDAVTLPAIIFCHGGGFVWGSIETHDGLCRRLAALTGAAVINVGYRLSPETKFPGPVEDACEVLRDLGERAAELGILANKIALCGDSAGGAICVSVAKRAARDGIALRHLALIYPALDPACDTASQHELSDGPLLTQAAMRWFWDCYLGTPDDSLDDLMPMQSAFLDRLPPTTISTAEYDPLRDEGAAFAAALTALGTDVDHRCYPGMIHAFMSLPASSPTIQAALNDIAARLRSDLL